MSKPTMTDADELRRRYLNDAVFNELVRRFMLATETGHLNFQDLRDAVDYAEILTEWDYRVRRGY